VKLADNSSLVIVEDDIFGDFENTPAPRLSAFDGLSRVIQIGSFSKTISASVRCGYIAARGDGSRAWSTSRLRPPSAVGAWPRGHHPSRDYR
jgi:DNA-binding transcriptional MocR family regulator